MVESPSDPDVLVIGGGLAGLVAARDLTAMGRRVVVLEARDRLGGRTWTSTLPGTSVEVELGGTWVHPDGQPAVAAEIARYGLEMRSYPAPTYEVFVGRDGRSVGLDGDSPLTARMRGLDGRVASVADRLRDGSGGRGDGVPADLDVSVAAWLDREPGPVGPHDALLAFTAAMGGGPPEELGILPMIRDAIDNGYDIDAGWADVGVSFVGGTRRLVASIADGLDVRLGAVVARVDQGADGVTVRLEDSGSRSATAAVVALPLNVWRDVEFDPPLVDGQATARATGHPGRSSKVLAVARDVPDGFAAAGWGTPLQAMVSMGEVDGGRLLVGFSGVQRVDGADREAVRAAVSAFLPDAEVVAHGGHDWVGDRFSRGAWFAEPPGWRRALGGADLEAPFGRLLFAGGDLPWVGAGWIEGAVASGARAAARAKAVLA